MTEKNPPPPKREIHTQIQAVVFRAKAFLLQTRRGWQNAFDSGVKRFSAANELENHSKIAESKTALWTESSPAEQFLLAGKIQNLRQAIRQLNNLEIPANEVFSFWAHVGKTTRGKGYVVGRELREGCIIPNLGGGLCQLSNALYDAALQAGFQIVERHAHTQVIAGSLAEKGRDATVFWNYVDLRFKSPQAFRIEAKLTAKDLIVRFKAAKSLPKMFQISARTKNNELENSPNSCATCGVGECFRSIKPEENLNFGRAAFLVDEFSPEFDDYLQKTRTANDLLFVPLDGERFKKANYAWTQDGFKKTKQSWLTTAIRAYKSRKLAAQGASRQRNLLEMSEKLAESYARKLNFEVLHVTVSQNLLPFLWKSGVLGGRTFDVLMTALPISALQDRLDFAFSRNPDSPTLGDFRAENWLVEAEREALKNARRIVTPHSEIAALFADKAVLLEWQMPIAKQRNRKLSETFTIVFPASTVGRKGAWELREAVRGLNVKIIILGAELEGAEFWNGFEVEHSAQDWLERADLVVLPAFVEHKPRRLLLAAAAGVPVIASKACGVDSIENVTTIENGDVAALRLEIEKAVFGRKPAALPIAEMAEIS